VFILYTVNHALHDTIGHPEVASMGPNLCLKRHAKHLKKPHSIPPAYFFVLLMSRWSKKVLLAYHLFGQNAESWTRVRL
jgi:hypothetical protein